MRNGEEETVTWPGINFSFEAILCWFFINLEALAQQMVARLEVP